MEESSPRKPHVSFAEPMQQPQHTTTVPLSSVPAEALTSSQQQQQEASCSSIRTTTTTAVSTKTGRLSQLLAVKKAEAADVGLRINRPRQVTGLATKYHKALAWTGRIGWVGKAVVYAMIGGLACQSAVGNDRPDPNLPQTEQISASPQGAFVLLGTTPQAGVSIVILLVMMVALLAYITWRMWEGLAGQGYDDTFSAKKNLFKFRVSPIVSGCVYISYLVFLISLLDREVRGVPSKPGPPKEGWPATWRHSAGGRVGLALLGIAFIIATCIQLQGVLTRQWHKDYRSDLPRPLMLTVFTIGHFGFAGRAGAFLSMAILFFKDAGGSEDAPHNSSMVANALQQLQANRGLRAVLMIVGLLLILYGLFAVLSACTRMFPTPPPSRRKRLPAAEYKQQQHEQQHLEKQHEQQRKPWWGLPWARHHRTPATTTSTTAASNGPAAGACSPSSVEKGDAGSAVGLTANAANGAAGAAAANGSAGDVCVDVSPGWGKDQGLNRASPQVESEDAPPIVQAPAAASGTCSAAPAVTMLVLPSQTRLAAAPPAAGGDVVPGRTAAVPKISRDYVTIDL